MKVLVNQLRDPLHETTRKVRRNLLASSVMGLAVVKVGLVPEKISAFGVEFSESNQEALLLFLAGIVFYFLISFLAYLSSEYAAWKLALKSEEIEHHQARASFDETDLQSHKNFIDNIIRLNKSMKYGKAYLVFRVIIEVFIPIGLSVWSILILL
jgi:hypothetical protein